MRTLLIVDPQKDFITGTLPVPDADRQLSHLAERLSSLSCDQVVVTVDCHPIGHISFVDQGGIWPIHCEKYSDGASIHPLLFSALREKSSEAPIHFIEKGKDVNRDEYSAFEKGYPDLFDEVDEILVSGVAGDVCVYTTVSDLVRHGLGNKLTVITDACPSLDGGTKLEELILQKSLKKTTLDTL